MKSYIVGNQLKLYIKINKASIFDLLAIFFITIIMFFYIKQYSNIVQYCIVGLGILNLKHSCVHDAIVVDEFRRVGRSDEHRRSKPG